METVSRRKRYSRGENQGETGLNQIKGEAHWEQMDTNQQSGNTLKAVTVVANTAPPVGTAGNADSRPRLLSCGRWEPDMENFH